MSETQLTFVLASAPTMLTVLIGILLNNSRLSDVRTDIHGLKADMNLRLGELRSDMNRQFAQVDRQFSDSRNIWRAELHRVEEILDARLKHLEER